MTSFVGTAGDDTFGGTQGYDSYFLGGGDDTVNARGGNDSFTLDAALTAADRLNAGGGSDYIYLNGDYSGGLVLAGATLVNFEQMYFTAGYTYDITVHDQTNTTVNGFYIGGYNLGASDSLIFDASAETTSYYSVIGGAGNDWLRGGDGNDYFDISYGGKDTVLGGHGGDTISPGAALSSNDRLNGGMGSDTLFLQGDYSGGLTFAAATLTGVEQISLSGGFDYDLTLHDGTIAAGEALLIAVYGLGSTDKLTLDASQETNGRISVTGGAGADWLAGGNQEDTLSGGVRADTIRGGGGDDLITGGQNRDVLTGGTGGDTFLFAWNDSPSQPDLIKDLTNADAIDLTSIDVDPGSSYDTFDLVSSFSNTPGEMRLTYDAVANRTSLLMDMDGDAAADMTILMSGQHTSFDNFLV
jgi:Ca2+-binding RTX toxin-like protein